MLDETGWIFWIEHDGRIRNFTVGHEDEEAAKLIIQRQYPDVTFLNFVSKQRAPAQLIKMLGLTGEKVMEWEPADPREKLKPSGVDIDSGYDPLRKKK